MSDNAFEARNEAFFVDSTEPTDSRALGPIPDWQLAELDRRRAHLKEHPESVMTWEEIVQKLRDRYSK